MAKRKYSKPLGLPKGRAGSVTRPGIFIRDYLLQHGEGSVSDIHQAYCGMLHAEWEKKMQTFYRRKRHIGGVGDAIPVREKRERYPQRPRYEAFARYFHYFKQLGYVELVMVSPGVPKEQVAKPKGRGPVTEIRKKHFYRLTANGTAAPSDDWERPRKALGYD